jgi:hypothetical protein
MKDKYKTKVVFLINETNDNDLMAFFPDEQYNNWDLNVKTCYSHMGQHSASSIEYAKECRLATDEESEDLKNELESIGYNLEIVQTFN